ncbi:MAG: helix-turn-helix domain-containing protein [Victivallaceae bacterium]|nr:helix-turn-helix domain-containing protein [Victivallaceae bacterium]
MRQNLIKLGSSIKAFRKEQNLTLAALSETTGLTAGLLSRIENFRTIPSLPVLLKIAEALKVTPAELLSGIGETSSPVWTLVRKNERTMVERENNKGFMYEMLLDTESSGGNLQTLILNIEPGALREKVKTDGDQFIFILKGSIVFCLGDEKINLSEGDILFFDGNIEHVPENPGSETAVLLAVYLLKEAK